MLFTSLVTLLSVAAASAGSSASLFDSLGNLSPYHKAPVPFGIEENLPADCKVDQVVLVSILPVLIVFLPL